MSSTQPQGGDNVRLHGKADRLIRLLRSVLDPRPWLGIVRLVNHYNYDHVTPRRQLTTGGSVRISPTASFRNAPRIFIGDNTRIGDDCALWAGNTSGRIRVGRDCSFGPRVYVTASNYEMDPGVPVMQQDTDEKDVVIGDGCWIGAHVIILPGVTVGAGSVIGAGAVVTKDLPDDSIAVGVPARVVGSRTVTA